MSEVQEKEKTVQLLEQLNCKMDKIVSLLESRTNNQQELDVEIVKKL